MRDFLFVIVFGLVMVAGCKEEELRFQHPGTLERGGLLPKHWVEFCKEQPDGLYRVSFRYKDQGFHTYPWEVIAAAAAQCYNIDQAIEVDVLMATNDYFGGEFRYKYIRYKFVTNDCQQAKQIGECIADYLWEHKKES